MAKLEVRVNGPLAIEALDEIVNGFKKEGYSVGKIYPSTGLEWTFYFSVEKAFEFEKSGT